MVSTCRARARLTRRSSDIDRIEVVRGPARNAVWPKRHRRRAERHHANAPTEDFEGYAQLKYGNYNDIASQLVVSGPLLGDKVLGRLAFATEDHDGYSLNLFNGKHYDDALYDPDRARVAALQLQAPI